MGKPAPAGIAAVGTPASGDQANQVLEGQFSVIGPGQPMILLGAFNVLIWAETNTALTTTAGSAAATVASATNLAAGQTINGANVPPGATIGAIAGTDITIAFAPGTSAADVAAGVDAAALFGDAPWVGTIRLERSFDGGRTYLVCGVGGAGQGAIYTGAALAGQPLSIVAAEPEKGVLYRLNCTALTGGVHPKFRISTTGAAATAWGIPPY